MVSDSSNNCIAFHILYRMLLILSACILLWLLLVSLTDHNITTDLFKRIGNTGYELFLFITVVYLFIFFVITKAWIEKQSTGKLKLIQRVLCVSSIIIYLVLFFSFRILPTTDSWVLIDEARYLAAHPGIIVDKQNVFYSYFCGYGNNAFLCLLFIRLFSFLDFLGIRDYLAVLYFLNAALLILGNYFVYRSLKECKGEYIATWGLFFLVCNPLSYLFAFWYYSATVSVPLMTGAVYYSVRLYKEKNRRFRIICAIIIGIFTALAYEIRPTSMIPVIAFLIVAAVSFFIVNGNRKKRTAYIGIIILTAFLTMKLCSMTTHPYFAKTESQTFPITHWLMMGSHGDGIHNKGDVRYTKSFKSKKEKTNHTLNRMLQNYRKNGFVGTIRLWEKKSAHTFTVGWADVQERLSSDTRFPPAYQLISGSRKEPLYFFCQGIRCVVFLFMLLAVFSRLRDLKFDPLFSISLLTFLGGVFFYCLWEAKSVYSFPFIPIMIMTASQCETLEMDSLISTKGTLAAMTGKRKKEIYAILALFWVLIVCYYYRPVCGKNYEYPNYSIRNKSLDKTSKINELKKKDAILTQSFHARKAFNTVDLYGKIPNKDKLANQSTKYNNEDAGYQINIEDKNGKNLVEMKVGLKHYNLQRRRFRLDLPKRFNPGEYVLKIKNLTGHNPVCFIHRTAMMLDTYEGICIINGEQQIYDLFISVADFRWAPYFGKKTYILFMLIFLLVPYAELEALKRIEAREG